MQSNTKVTFSNLGSIDSTTEYKAKDHFIDQTASISLLDILGVPNWVPNKSSLFGPNSLAKMKDITEKNLKPFCDDGPTEFHIL
tara:strand:- start:96 stop:347 length:252 start_codon:yes stop_codon:yes gene_type:complete